MSGQLYEGGAAGGGGGVNLAASNTTYTSGTVVLSGSTNITVLTNGNTILLSGNDPAAAAGVSALQASDATYTSGKVIFTGVGGGITVSSNTGQRIDLSVAAPVAQTGTQFSAGVSTLGNTAGNTGTVGNRVVLAGVNGITLSQSTDAGGASVSISGPALLRAGVSTVGNTAGNTGTVARELVLAGGNNITLSGSTAGGAGVSQTITISAPNAQTAISGLAGSNTTYTSGTVTITGVGGGVTVSSNTGQRIDISVAAPVAQTGTQFSAGISGGNTSGDTGTVAGRVVFAGGNNITLSGSTNGVSETITISAFTQTVQTQNRFNLTLSGNSTSGGGGYIQISSGTMTLAGGNNITLSQDGNAVTISGGAGAGGFAGGGISGGNTSGDTGTVTGRLVFAGTPSITLSGSTNGGSQTITISAPATTSLSASTNITLSVDVSTIKFSVANPEKIHVWRNFERQDGGVAVHLSAISKTPFYFEEILPGRVTLNSVIIQLSNVTTGTLQSFDVHFGVYTFVNSTSAALLGSASNNFVASTASSASFSGMRHWVLTSPSTHTGISNLTPGNYLFGMMFSATASGAINQSLWGVSGTATSAQPLGMLLPGNNQMSTGTSQGAVPMFGQGSTTVNALPANVVASEIRNQGTATIAIRPWVLIRS